MTIAASLSALSRRAKRILLLAVDALTMLACLWAAYSIRLEQFYVVRQPAQLLVWAAAVAGGLLCLRFAGFYRAVIRLFDERAARRLLPGAAGAATVYVLCDYFSEMRGSPRSVSMIYFILLLVVMFFGRALASHVLAGTPRRSSPRRGQPSGETGIAIYGANAAGASLAGAIRRRPGYALRFFVDDDPALVGRTVLGVPVRGLADLRAAAQAGRITQVLLAMPGTSRAARLAAVSALADWPVQVVTVPAHEEVVSGRYTLSDLRPVRVEELLQRDCVPPMERLIEEGVTGRTVLVTGAGGSIGSEICRQLRLYAPARMVLLDQSEFALYQIADEFERLREDDGRGAAIEVVPKLGSVLDGELLRAELERCKVDTVFHAAAYKHVPLLEDNETVGVENNVFGTKTLADACVAAGVERFTMVSTDKAVRPTNVMGASKRVAELYIQALSRQQGMRTRFGIVRFGNVLDSSGSVVQLFRRQLARGGPITVTDPEATRFFMSIPEATQLVLQANAMARGGEVFVLEMGDPVRVVELAKLMISSSGMTEKSADNPGGDIEIKYIGLRPGEKLHEELFVSERVTDTAHPQIRQAAEPCLPRDLLEARLARLADVLRAHDRQAARALLQALVASDARASLKLSA